MRLEVADMRNTLQHYVVGSIHVAGCDEAGRGCLAGPVFAAAVVLPEEPDMELKRLLKDSKKLTAKQRDHLRVIIEQQAVTFGVAPVNHHEIDRLNILQASMKAMHLALGKLNPQPGLILVDGNRFLKYADIPHICMVKGDAIWLAIAAASVLAKTWRDEYMVEQHRQFPLYGWNENKGYPTAKHREALKKYGPSPIHRKTFRLLYG